MIRLALIFAAGLLLSSCNGTAGSKPLVEGSSTMTGRSQAAPRSVEPSKTPIVLAKTSKVKIFLVSVGKTEDASGCHDSLTAVDRTIKPTAAPLRSALEELLAVSNTREAAGHDLENFWKGTDLHVAGVALKDGTARIDISGQLLIAGACDGSRIIDQIEATARQFPSIKNVNVTVNGTALAEVVSRTVSASQTNAADH